MTTQWNDGPPPSIGWWPTLVANRYERVRWWNGEHWSPACVEGDSAKEIARKAVLSSVFENDQIQWSARPSTWPQRSRT